MLEQRISMGNTCPSGAVQKFTPSHVKTGVGRPILVHTSGMVGGIDGGYGGVSWRGALWGGGGKKEGIGGNSPYQPGSCHCQGRSGPRSW
jgi:hypothetical protein